MSEIDEVRLTEKDELGSALCAGTEIAQPLAAKLQQ